MAAVMTAYILAAVVAVGSILWFFVADDIRQHQSVSGLVAGLAFAGALVAAHFIGW
jgi:hypothetical protein